MTQGDLPEQWARARTRVFASAMNPDVLAFWRAMPPRWTRVEDLVNGSPQSTISTRLGVLLQAGAVDRKRGEGRIVYYRPRPRMHVEAEVNR